MVQQGQVEMAPMVVMAEIRSLAEYLFMGVLVVVEAVQQIKLGEVGAELAALVQLLQAAIHRSEVDEMRRAGVVMALTERQEVRLNTAVAAVGLVKLTQPDSLAVVACTEQAVGVEEAA